MPKVVPTYAEQARGRIMQTASLALSRRGYHRTTMEDIAREVGVSKGALYMYFKNKESLVRAICRAGPARLRETLYDSFTGDDLLASTNKFFERFLEETFENVALNYEILAESSRNPGIKKILREAYEKSIEVTAEFLEKMKREKVIREDVHAQALARGLVAMYDGLMAGIIMGADRDQIKGAWKESMSVLLEGLTTKSQKTGMPRGTIAG